MKKYIVALYRMVTSEKWCVISINKEVEAHFTSKKINTTDCYMLSAEFKEMATEINQQEYLLDQFRNN